ncbi:MAG: hypothetical protein JJE29_07525 [Peptostreptococcaceae bacterium]|nr:hypothetical protein [Peptostreptococcaceae bacterium]
MINISGYSYPPYSPRQFDQLSGDYLIFKIAITTTEDGNLIGTPSNGNMVLEIEEYFSTADAGAKERFRLTGTETGDTLTLTDIRGQTFYQKGTAEGFRWDFIQTL